MLRSVFAFKKRDEAQTAIKTPKLGIEGLAYFIDDPEELARQIHLIAEGLAGLPCDRVKLAAYFDFAKKHCPRNPEIVRALKDEVFALREARETPEEKPRTLRTLAIEPPLHPAVDYRKDFMTLGFRLHNADEDKVLVVSDGDSVAAHINPVTYTHPITGERYKVEMPDTLPYVDEVWTLKEVKKLTARVGGFAPPARLLRDELCKAYYTYLDLPDEIYELMAVWTIGTYFAQLFNAYPFLFFQGNKECGKSKTLEVLGYLCFNAWKGRDISAAAMGRYMTDIRGTLLFDQAERLKSAAKSNNFIGLLADSYKRAGGKRKIISGSRVLEFETYGPKAFASTTELDFDLSDRCFRIDMRKASRRTPDVNPDAPVFAQLRDALYRFALGRFKDVRVTYKDMSVDGSRKGELERALRTIRKLAGG